MDFQSIIYEKKDDIALITLNRPARLNAWTHTMNRELMQALSEANDDGDVGCIIVTGAGRGFCAGADIQDNFKARMDGDAGGEVQASNTGNWVTLCRESKPLIAAVNGAAVGVGLTMILPFDVIIASEAARFAFAFVKMGVVPELASSHLLVQRVGFGQASEMCMTGRLYSAAEAHERGLTNQVVPADELMNTAREVAGLIAANPARQLRMIKKLLTDNGSETDMDLVQRREGMALAEAYQSPEHKEAIQAFLEKRPPNFRNL